MSEKTIIAIDGNSLINRAFYAIPPLSTKSGIHTNAVYGFVGMLNSLIGEHKPEYICVAFDLKEPTFRHKEYAEYKAGRKKMPFELAEQFPLLKKVLKAMDIKILELPGFEADDIIGTVARRGEAAGLEPLVITGDKDALQLVSDTTRVIITKRGVSDFDFYDEDAMFERYNMTPQQFIDLKGLMGDSSDNIPGIPGVGEKTGIKLIEKFGSVENLVQNYEKITKAGLRAKVEEYRAQALMSKKLATINTNAPLEIDFEEFRLDTPDKAEVLKVYRELELFSLISKIDKTWLGNFAAEAGSAEMKAGAAEGAGFEESYTEAGGIHCKNIPELPENVIIHIEGRDGFSPSEDDLKNLFGELKNEGVFVYLKVFGDNNHVKAPEIYGAAFLIKEDLYYLTAGKSVAAAAMMVSEAYVGIKGHLLKDDYYMLNCVCMGEGFASGDFEPLRFNTEYDTGIAEYVLEPSRSDFGLKNMSVRYGGTDIMDESEFMKVNSQVDLFADNDTKLAEYALEIFRLCALVEPVQRGRMAEWELDRLCYEIEFPLIEIFAAMETIGFRTDSDVLNEIGTIINDRLEGLSDTIYDMAGESFNINSPKQLGVILFEKLGMPSGKKTKTGYSTSVDVLEKLREDYEIIDYILEYRTLTKLKSTYVEGLLPLIGSDGRIRAHFQQTGTATGRISCTEPNLQNIPVRTELGRQLRRAFIADEGWVMVDADYSQIELRVLAHVSGDEGMIEAFRSGADIHRATAAKVFEINEDEVTSAQRSSAKAVNFGVIYGMSGFGLSENLKITRKQASEYIADYFEKYKGVKSYMDKTVEGCRKDGFVTTISGRRREIPDIKASNFIRRQLGERLAMNSPIQGSAADIIKIAMIKVYDELRDKNMKAKLILQVHDELIIVAPPEEVDKVEELLRRNMSQALELAVPLEVGLEKGSNWYEVH